MVHMDFTSKPLAHPLHDDGDAPARVASKSHRAQPRSMAQNNKRRHARTRAKNLTAHLQVHERVTPCFIEDISPGGAFARTDERLAPGSAILVELPQHELRLRGVVVMADPLRRGVGLRFEGTEPAMQARLDRLLGDLQGKGDVANNAGLNASLRAFATTVVPEVQRNPSSPPQPAPVLMAPSMSGSMTSSAPIEMPGMAPPHATLLAPPLEGPLSPPTGGPLAPPASGPGRTSSSLQDEVARLERVLAERDAELLMAREEVELVRRESVVREGSDRLVARLQGEVQRLEAALVERQSYRQNEVDVVRRQADEAMQALMNTITLLDRLR
jgi:hypothetical protein